MKRKEYTNTIKFKMKKKEYKDGIKSARLEGIAQGWQEAKEAQKTNLPPVLDIVDRFLCSLRFTEKIDEELLDDALEALGDYYDQNRVKTIFTLEEVEQIIKITFNESRLTQVRGLFSSGGKFQDAEQLFFALKDHFEENYTINGFAGYNEKI